METEHFKLLRLKNQYLLSQGPSNEVVAGLIGLQAQYGANAMHALRIRSSDTSDLSGYVKTWSLRGTLHLHRKVDLPLVLYRGSETAFGQMAFLDGGIACYRGEYFKEIVLSELLQGDRSRDELKNICLEKGMSEREEQIILHPWGGLFRALAEKGEIAYTSAGNRVFTRLDPKEPMDEEEALTEMMRRYLAHYGPVSLRDAQTFFGLPQKRLKKLLESTARESLLFAGRTYFVENQELPEPEELPKVLFLAGFDQLLLGYRKTENPFLPENAVKRVNNNTGIVFPTVLLNGKVCAIWRRLGRKLELRTLHKIGVRDRRAIERKAVDNFGIVALQWMEA